jgi:hypothetical protein
VDKEDIEEQQVVNPLNPIMLTFLGFFIFPFFLAYSFDLLAYGPYILNHFRDNIFLDAILAVDLYILGSLIAIKRYVKNNQFDEEEAYATALIVGLFVMMINFSPFATVIFILYNYLPSIYNLKDIISMVLLLVYIAIMAYFFIKIITFPNNKESNNESKGKGKN